MTAVARLRLVSRLRRLPRWRTLLAAVVLALVVVGVYSAVRPSSPAPAATGKAAAKDNRTLLGVLTGLDPAVVRAVGAGGLANPLTAVPGAPGLQGATGHPQVVFLATEGCGACAAQRWSMVIALGRFGTLKNVLLAVSSSTEATGALATFTFRGLQYTSGHVDLVAAETADPDGKSLATLSPGDQQVVTQYDAPPYVPEALRGSVPWLDVANRYVMSGSGYSASLLHGLSWTQIAEKLGDAKDPVTQAVVGDANWVTAAICRVTGMTPASVCQSAPIQDLAQRLG